MCRQTGETWLQDIGNLWSNTTLRVTFSTTQTQSWTIFWTNIFFDFSSEFPSINNLLKRLNNCDLVKEIKIHDSISFPDQWLQKLVCSLWKMKYVYVKYNLVRIGPSIGTNWHCTWLILATVIKLIDDTVSENICTYEESPRGAASGLRSCQIFYFFGDFRHLSWAWACANGLRF